jgi:hypothetical protein
MSFLRRRDQNPSPEPVDGGGLLPSSAGTGPVWSPGRDADGEGDASACEPPRSLRGGDPTAAAASAGTRPVVLTDAFGGGGGPATARALPVVLETPEVVALATLRTPEVRGDPPAASLETSDSTLISAS